MKKLLSISLILTLLFSNSLFAATDDGQEQFYASYSYGVNRLYITNCLEAVYSTGSGPISITAIVSPDFDISNTNSIRLIAQTGFTISVDLPTDRSAALTSSGITFSTNKTADGSVKQFKLYIHKINKATIPYDVAFSSLYPSSATNPDFIGWSYRMVAPNNSLYLSSTSHSAYMAFDPSAITDSLNCTYYGSNTTTQTGFTSSIDASIDGVNWTTIKSYNNNLTKNDGTAAEKNISVSLKNVVGAKYIRFLLLTKGASDPGLIISQLGIKNQTVLPLKLLAFKGSSLYDKAYLNWSSTNEINVKDFTVEKSQDGKVFNTVGLVPAKNISGVNNYSISDNLDKGYENTYYRLKITDFDGSFVNSSLINIKSLKIGTESKLILYPNPVINTVNIEHDIALSNAIIEIFSVNGVRVSSVKVAQGEFISTIDVSELANGIYLLNFDNNGKIETVKFSK